MKKYTIIQNKKESFLSKATHNLILHEPIGGPSKRISEREGLCIYLTPQEHYWVHNTAEGEKQDLIWCGIMQRVWIAKKVYETDLSLEEIRKEWYGMFYKFYE